MCNMTLRSTASGSDLIQKYESDRMAHPTHSGPGRILQENSNPLAPSVHMVPIRFFLRTASVCQYRYGSTGMVIPSCWYRYDSQDPALTPNKSPESCCQFFLNLFTFHSGTYPYPYLCPYSYPHPYPCPYPYPYPYPCPYPCPLSSIAVCYYLPKVSVGKLSFVCKILYIP